MAIARICDACGKCYNEAEQENQLIAVTDCTSKHGVVLLECPKPHSKYGHTQVSLPQRLDICNECYTKILKIVHPDSRENPPC